MLPQQSSEEQNTYYNPAVISTSAEEMISPVSEDEQEFDAEEVFNLAKTDLDFLAGLAMPLVFKYLFPAVFKSIWEWFLIYLTKTRDFSQLAIGLPRGFGKTIVIKLAILYTILFTKKQFILVICENEDKAISILSDVVDMLNEPNIIAVFGKWDMISKSVINQKAKKVFPFRGRDIILKGVGASTGIRGITEKNRRPDLMIFDDIQSREAAESIIQSSQLETWMVGTAMKAKSPEGCLFVFVANMYPTPGSLLRRLKSNPNWIKYIVGGITERGESLWEELQPIDQLIREFQNDLAAGHPEIFYSEVLNDPNASVNNIVDLSLIPDWPYESPDDYPCLGKFIVIDPSNDKANSDSCAIGQFDVMPNNIPALMHLIEERLSPGDIIHKAIKLAFETQTSIILVEGTGYQYSLLYWFTHITDQMGIQGLQFLELTTGIKQKQVRIVQMLKQLVPGEILLHPSVRAAIYQQITQFNPLKSDNVDNALDILTYANKALELYGTLIYNSTLIELQAHDAHEVILDNSPF